MNRKQRKQTARQLRQKSVKSERLLWSVLRAKQLCGLKFRRQHPIGSYITDFACVSKNLVVEVDGDYHDYTAESDLKREAWIRDHGWDVLRFSDKEVEEDVEAVARGIVNHLGLEYEFLNRKGTGSGMMSTRCDR